MSGWTKHLKQASEPSTQDGSTSSSSAAAAAGSPNSIAFVVGSSSVSDWISTGSRDYYLGQEFSTALSERFQECVGRLARKEEDVDAQQEIIDLLRQGLQQQSSTDEQSSEQSSTTSSSSSSAASAPADNMSAITLCSFAHGLNRCASFTLLGSQYSSLLDVLSWDLLEMFLGALHKEWVRTSRATVQAHKASPVDMQTMAGQRPVTSASISLLLHLLQQVAQHASPRDVLLQFCSWFESQVHAPLEEEEFPAEEFDEDDDLEEEEMESKQLAARQRLLASPDYIPPFYRLSLVFPLLDLLEDVLSNVSKQMQSAERKKVLTASDAAAQQKQQAQSSESSYNTAAAPALAQRQADLFQQCLTMFNQILVHLSHQISLLQSVDNVEKPSSAGVAELKGWFAMQDRFLKKALHILQPVLYGINLPHSSLSSSSSSIIPTPTLSGSLTHVQSSLRVSILSFLFSSLSRFSNTLTDSQSSELQQIIEGNRAFIQRLRERSAEKEKKKQQQKSSNDDDDDDDDEAVSSLNPSIALLLSSLFSLLQALDRTNLTPQYLFQYFQEKKSLELAIETEEMKSWEKEEDNGNFDEDDEDDENEEEDDEDDDDDEINDDNLLSDEDKAVRAAKKQKKQSTKKAPSLLSQLRHQLQSHPNWNIHGIHVYSCVTLTLRYFWHIKRARNRNQQASGSSSASSAALEFDQLDKDLEAFMLPYSAVGSYYILEAQSLKPVQLLDATSPFICIGLLQGLSSMRMSDVWRGIGALTSLWALIPPAAIDLSTATTNSTVSPSSSSTEAITSALEQSGVWQLNETLLQCCYLCPNANWQLLRQSLLYTWKIFLACLTPPTRLQLLFLANNTCNTPSVQAVIVARIKDELNEAYLRAQACLVASKSALSPAQLQYERAEVKCILNEDVLASLHSTLVQCEGLSLRNAIDCILAMVNLFTFLVLRDRTEQQQLVDLIQKDKISPEVLDSNFKARGGRLGLSLPAVRIVWKEKWSEIHAVAQKETQEVEEELKEAQAAAPSSNLPSRMQNDEIANLVVLRNQLQLMVDLTARLLQHMNVAPVDMSSIQSALAKPAATPSISESDSKEPQQQNKMNDPNEMD